MKYTLTLEHVAWITTRGVQIANEITYKDGLICHFPNWKVKTLSSLTKNIQAKHDRKFSYRQPNKIIA